jgi:hypothetical protein
MESRWQGELIRGAWRLTNAEINFSKVFIKDVKSSNGTFINGSRLSPEGQESDIFELHTDDIVEFGIDIVGEDNKTTLHHKVACRAFLVMTAEEALGIRHDFAALYRGGIAGSTLNHHTVGPGAEGGLRRSKGGAGGGNGYGASGNGGAMMSFDHILHKLQAELQKSRDTAGELGNLNSAMHDIGETLGGGLPPMQHPPYQHMVPSINGEREAQKAGAEAGQANAAKASSEGMVKVLEEQVQETQRALNVHVDRLALLETRLEGHDAVKTDVDLMRSQVEEARRELAEALRMRSLAGQGGVMRNGRGVEAHKEQRELLDIDDFDDGASMASVDTVVQGNEPAKLGNALMGVDEIESADLASRGVLLDEDHLDDAETLQRLKNHIGPRAPADGVPIPSDDAANQRNEELSKRLQVIESQLERALELGKVLADQHAEASQAVKRLEEKVKSLEEVKEIRPEANKASDPVASSAEIGGAVGIVGGIGAAGGVLAILEEKWGKWRDAFEADFETEKADFRQEREEVKRVVKMWDGLNQDVEDALDLDAASEGSKSESVQEDPPSSPPLPGSRTISKSARKRNKKRDAAAAAALATTSSTPTTSSVGLSTSAAPRSLDSTARINRELRSLLYSEDFNLLVRSQNSRGEETNATPTDREETPTPSDIGIGRIDDEGDGTFRSRMHSQLASQAKRRPIGSGNERSAASVRAGLDGPAALPMLGMAGVIVVGMTAWVISGGKVHLTSAPGSF